MDDDFLRSGFLRHEMRFNHVMEKIFLKYSHEFVGSPEVNLSFEIPSDFKKLNSLLHNKEAQFEKRKSLKRRVQGNWIGCNRQEEEKMKGHLPRSTLKMNQVSLSLSSTCSSDWNMRGCRPTGEQKYFPLHNDRLALKSSQLKKFIETCPDDILMDETNGQNIPTLRFKIARNTSQVNRVSLHMASPCSPDWYMTGCRATDKQKCCPLPFSFRRLDFKSPQLKKFNETCPADILVDETNDQDIKRSNSQVNEVSLNMSSPCSPGWKVKGCRSTDERLALMSPHLKKFIETCPDDILMGETNGQNIRTPRFKTARYTSQGNDHP